MGVAVLYRDWDALYRIAVGEDGTTMMPVDQFATRLDDMLSGTDVDVVELNEIGTRLFRAEAYELAKLCYARAAEDDMAIGAQANLGRCDIRLGYPDEAERVARSVVLRHPGLLPGWHLLAESLIVQGKYAEAADAYRSAIAIAPQHAALHGQLGLACEKANEPEAARAAYECALSVDPHDGLSLCSLVALKRRICDWNGLDELGARLWACMEAGRVDGSPINFLSEGASAAQELACASRQAMKLQDAAEHKPVAMDPFTVPVSGPLRVGFISYGFGFHPTAILTSALFEQLRSSAIEVHLFATSDDPDNAPRRRLMVAARGFHQVAHLTPMALAQQVRALGIEILIDLDGYSRSCKPEVFSFRPAPIQVNWLGYPGTTGARFLDYVIADRFVLPESLQPHFSERAVYLPRCYQSNDPTRVVGTPPSREECGLPARGIVYVCFNVSYKLNPRSVARMLRTLAAVPGSVLWLLKGPGLATDRLRQAACAAGVEPERLVFMDMLPHPSYLARYRHADLFLDTEHYNAHTTASDALWAGCPVLTRPGETFATRVAGSLNHHLGMDELNVVSDDEFVAAAVRYGRNPGACMALREKLARQKRLSGLFDVAGYAQDFALLLSRLASHHRSGGTPANFPVE